jgi:glutamyl-Q tRNA(Asp) synthetase
MPNLQYVGRFAPSPSGDLHFGSLVAALGSYLQAHANQGQWLVRIEDIDPPREVAGSAARILNALECYGLFWDGEILYQSSRYEAYRHILQQLHQADKSYYCHCSRSRIQNLGGFYDGHCRKLHMPAGDAATRLYQTKPVYGFDDRRLGRLSVDDRLAEEDFIIHRRDGLFAYNLAVVIDDHYQGVTEVVRGADLIEPTVRQISLYHHLGWPVPTYMHLPLALNKEGKKLSKQNHAPALELNRPIESLIEALKFLGQPLPDDVQDAKPEQLLEWSIKNWSVIGIPN